MPPPLLLSMRRFTEPVHGVQYGVARNRQRPRFGAPLGVQGLAYVGDVVQNVKAVQHHGQTALQELLGHTEIPHRGVRVEGLVGVTLAAIHGWHPWNLPNHGGGLSCS